MGEDNTSFWTDIKQYEAVLERDPASYAFIPLSNLYRKIGLFDDALAVAQRGCSRHPNLVAGQLSLGLACHELGLTAKCRHALENVVRITPENVEAQRILSRMYADAGEHTAAESSLRIILSLAPNDLESRVIQDSLYRARGAGDSGPLPEQADVDETVISGLDETPTVRLYPSEVERATETSRITDLPDEETFLAEAGDDEILDLDDACIIEDLEEISDEVSEVVPYEAVPDQAPLVSATMAELYVKQGFNDLAIGIYRQLVAANPTDVDLLTRLDELLTAERTAHHGPTVLMPHGLSSDMQQPAEAYTESTGGADMLNEPATRRQGTIAILEGWLESIRRVRACRSSLH